MSYPNNYPGEPKIGSKSYGYYVKPANNYSYNGKSSLTNSWEPEEVPYPDQPLPVYQAVSKSYGSCRKPARGYAYDDKRAGDDPSQPLLGSTQGSSKAPGCVTQREEQDDLAQELRLQGEAWDKKLSATDPKKVSSTEIALLKKQLETMAREARKRWRKEGRSRREIIGLMREERLREEDRFVFLKEREGWMKKAR